MSQEDSEIRPKLLYCHCAYAQVVPKDTKEAVLKSLCSSGRPFEAVADLCEMSARRDPALKRLATDGSLKIAACFPRAVKWLFSAANAPLSLDAAEVLNMRTEPGEDVISGLNNPELSPNIPHGKETMPSFNQTPA
jgi:hypothetical protein